MGIRQGPDAIKMYEEHIRFMILAEHELCEETTAAADQEAFNSHLNLEQINKVNMQQGFTLPSVGIVAITTSLSWVQSSSVTWSRQIQSLLLQGALL